MIYHSETKQTTMMKKIWSYRFYILIVLGQIITWLNISDTWNNNVHFALWAIGMAVSVIGTLLQILIAPNYSIPYSNKQ